MDARTIIRELGLEPHLEGGWYRETFRSEAVLPGGGADSSRNLSTAIYFLLTAGNASRMHRIAHEELFHFYLGDPVEMLQLRPGGRSARLILGTDLLAGQRPQAVVPAGVWQGSALVEGGNWALLGTTVAPGFDFEDFQIADRQELLAGWPDEAEAIERLTRP